MDGLKDILFFASCLIVNSFKLPSDPLLKFQWKFFKILKCKKNIMDFHITRF